jgi:hypothetical protein
LFEYRRIFEVSDGGVALRRSTDGRAPSVPVAPQAGYIYNDGAIPRKKSKGLVAHVHAAVAVAADAIDERSSEIHSKHRVI